MKKNKLIFGCLGSGKTEFAINLSRKKMLFSGKVSLIDLDMHNKYFSLKNIKNKLLGSEFSNVDIFIPEKGNENGEVFFINPKIYSKFLDSSINIVDNSGMIEGINLINSLDNVIEKNNTEVFYVINPFREDSSDKYEIEKNISEYNNKSNFKINYIVANPNLKDITSKQNIIYGHKLIKEICDKNNIIYKYIMIEDKFGYLENELEVEVIKIDRSFDLF